ncbi:unnamed protein product [Amoebophrya sp. A25]|nr:unnamed protein product [Amoebophrya sp. A25]|eukprot:GSA25T00022834001.1
MLYAVAMVLTGTCLLLTGIRCVGPGVVAINLSHRGRAGHYVDSSQYDRTGALAAELASGARSGGDGDEEDLGGVEDGGRASSSRGKGGTGKKDTDRSKTNTGASSTWLWTSSEETQGRDEGISQDSKQDTKTTSRKQIASYPTLLGDLAQETKLIFAAENSDGNIASSSSEEGEGDEEAVSVDDSVSLDEHESCQCPETSILAAIGYFMIQQGGCAIYQSGLFYLLGRASPSRAAILSGLITSGNGLSAFVWSLYFNIVCARGAIIFFTSSGVLWTVTALLGAFCVLSGDVEPGRHSNQQLEDADDSIRLDDEDARIEIIDRSELTTGGSEAEDEDTLGQINTDGERKAFSIAEDNIEGTHLPTINGKDGSRSSFPLRDDRTELLLPPSELSPGKTQRSRPDTTDQEGSSPEMLELPRTTGSKMLPMLPRSTNWRNRQRTAPPAYLRSYYFFMQPKGGNDRTTPLLITPVPPLPESLPRSLSDPSSRHEHRNHVRRRAASMDSYNPNASAWAPSWRTSMELVVELSLEPNLLVRKREVVPNFECSTKQMLSSVCFWLVAAQFALLQGVGSGFYLANADTLYAAYSWGGKGGTLASLLQVQSLVNAGARIGFGFLMDSLRRVSFLQVEFARHLLFTALCTLLSLIFVPHTPLAAFVFLGIGFGGDWAIMPAILSSWYGRGNVAVGFNVACLVFVVLGNGLAFLFVAVEKPAEESEDPNALRFRLTAAAEWMRKGSVLLCVLSLFFGAWLTYLRPCRTGADGRLSVVDR